MDFIFKPLHLAQVIHASIMDVKSLTEKSEINIHFDAQSDPLVTGDYDRLMQVIINLLSNAIRYSSPGQTIDISLSERTDTVHVAVRDYGPGVPLSFQSKIFQKFSQADTSASR